MTEILSNLQSQNWFGIVTAVIALASAVASISPTPAPGSTWSKVYVVLDFLALNILKAKDTGVPPTTPGAPK